MFSHSVMSDSLWPMDWSMPDFPVLGHLPESPQTHVPWVRDAIQSSCPLSSPSPPAFNHSQHQGLFWRVSSLHHVAKVLELQLQHQSFQWIFRIEYSFPNLKPVCCSMSHSNCCFLTCIQVYLKCISYFQYLKWCLSWEKFIIPRKKRGT